MARRKIEQPAAKQSSYGNILAATRNATKQPPPLLAPTPHFVDQLADIALTLNANEFDGLKKEQGEHFDINQRNLSGDSAFHVLMTKMDEKIVPAIIFLLERGATFSVQNNAQQTPLHLLAINGASSQILEFWQCTRIWDFLIDFHIKEQTHIFIADASGKTVLHYLMMKPGDENLRLLFKNLFPSDKVDNQDNEGNTPLHVAAQYGNDAGIEFYLSLSHEEHSGGNEYFVMTNHAGQTPADLARINRNADIARILYRREFIFTSFHHYSQEWFEKEKDLLRPTATLADYQQKIITRLRQLAKTITIAPSEINSSILGIFRAHNIDVTVTNKGIEIQLDKIDPTKRRKIYELTPIGQLESELRSTIEFNLSYSSPEEEIEEHIDAKQQEDDDSSDADYKVHEKEDSIRNKPTSLLNRKAAAKQKQETIDQEDLTTNAPVEKEGIGQLLDDDFIRLPFIEQLIELLNKSNLDIPPILLSSLILSFDFQFNDMDINKDGFLIDAIEKSFHANFADEFSKTEAQHLALDFIETCGRSAPLIQDIRSFNEAEKNNNLLNQQQVWIRMQLLLKRFVTQNTNPNPRLKRSLSTKFTQLVKTTDYIELSEKTNTLIKIFPTDESSILFYENKSDNKLALDLKPLFKTLQTIAKASREIIVKHAKTPEKAKTTNVITAYLLLVAGAQDNLGRVRQQFIRIPIVLNIEKKLLSKDVADGVFASKHEFDVSIGEDRQHGANIAHREPTFDVAATSELAKQKVLRILSCLKLSETENQQIIDKLQAAQVEKPLQLDYEMLARVQQDTLYNHSERVIFKALKMPRNITRIVDYLYEECKQNFPDCSSYKVEAGCLLLYSYPNSVCDECGLGVLALQDSEQEGFIHLIIHALQNFRPSSTSSSATLSLPLFTVDKKSSDSTSCLTFTTIVASEQIFSSDSYAYILNTYPRAKIDSFVDGPSFFSKPGISLSASAPSHFYEFIAPDLTNVPLTAPYGGSVTMSGSKNDKIPEKKIPLAEKEVADFIEKHDVQMRR